MLLVFAAALAIKLNYFKVKLLFFSCASTDVLSTTKTLSCKLMNPEAYCKLNILSLCNICFHIKRLKSLNTKACESE